MGTVRFVLALLVVIFHLASVPNVGHLAVQAFFVLSGYLMTLVMQESYGYSASGIGRFWANRILRLYPMYLALVVLTLGLIAWLGEPVTSTFSGGIFLPETPVEWLQNLTFIYWNWIPVHEYPRLVSPSWALTVELAYYLLISLGLSRSVRLTWAWFAFGVGWYIWLIASNQTYDFGYFHIASGALPFSLGALIWHYRGTIDGWMAKVQLTPNRIALALIAAGFGGMFLAAALRVLVVLLGADETLETVVMLAHPFSAVLLILGVRKLSHTGRAKSWDKTLGDLSYPIYVSHYLFAIPVARITGLVSPGRDLLSAVTTLMTLPVMCLGCWVLVQLIDRPIERWRDRIRGARGQG